MLRDVPCNGGKKMFYMIYTFCAANKNIFVPFALFAAEKIGCCCYDSECPHT